MNIADMHPALSGFVPAFLTGAVLIELFSFFSPLHRQQNFSLLLSFMACLFSLPTFVTGYVASGPAYEVFGVPVESIAWHHWVSRGLVFTLIPLAALAWIIFRGGKKLFRVRQFYQTLLLFSWGLALYTGYLGGQLVFVHGAGVAPRQVQRDSY
jgi:uncharacterized membrane protein